MPIGTRGLQLYSSSEYVKSNPNTWPKFLSDFDMLDSIGFGNLNSVKTVLYSYIERGPDNRPSYQSRQRNKIERIVSKVGSNATYVFRCWPLWGNQGDWKPATGPVNFYRSGVHFAQELANPFDFIQNTLQLPNVIMEVANEPNIESPFKDATSPPDAYNNFFRGFYFGQQQAGYNFPLAYAGLSPNGTATSWYQNVNVQQHIADYATKIGCHIYWQPGQMNSVLEGGGKFYRTVKNILSAAGIGPKGIVITEFNTPRDAYGGNATNQITEVCNWWRNEQADANAGWWCEQAILYISNADDASDILRYTVQPAQINTIRDC